MLVTQFLWDTCSNVGVGGEPRASSSSNIERIQTVRFEDPAGPRVVGDARGVVSSSNVLGEETWSS